MYMPTWLLTKSMYSLMIVWKSSMLGVHQPLKIGLIWRKTGTFYVFESAWSMTMCALGQSTASSLSFPRRWPDSQRGLFGLVFLLCGSVTRPAPAVASMSEVPFKVPLEWNEFRCQASARLQQKPTRPRASDGNQAAPLASPSRLPVQCTIPNPLAFFLILVFFTGHKGGDFLPECASSSRRATGPPAGC
jgi:hypothetical protein